MKDFYFILGVAPSANSREIKDAFRKLCLKYHPDKNADNPYNQERYMDICEAYRVLSNKSKRVAYDKKRPGDKTQIIVEELAKIKTGLYPEIKTSYKGLYPWFAVFSVLIVASLALVFNLTGKGTVYYEKPAAPVPVIKPVLADTIKPEPVAAITDTVQANDSVFTSDALSDFVTSALQEHTVESKAGSAGRNHRYSLKSNYLFVVYENNQKGETTQKEVSIPIKDIESIFYRSGQLWINNKRKSIKTFDLRSGEQVRADHFSVSFDTSGTPGLEHKLAEAFTMLKTL